MELFLIILLVIIIISLLIYNIKIYRQVQSFSNTNQKINSLNILQDFMNIVGEESSVDNKIDKINTAIIEKFEIKYSTIVVFNGAEYEIKASNVDPKHWDVLKNLHQEEIFKDSITSATPKYVTVENEEERLPYQKVELGRAKSAMFFPLYIENVYIGYWIIESGAIHAFDGIDTTILEVIKEDIVNILKTVSYQDTLENISRTDLFTQLQSAEYLYGKGKRNIDKFTMSTVCMLKIINLEEINENYSRKLGNQVVIEVSNMIKENISSEYLFVRYMGPKFAIVFCGVEPDGVFKFLEGLKKYVEELQISENGIVEEKNVIKEEYLEDTKKKSKKKPKKKEMVASPKLNFVVSTYYKGTALENLNQKLEEYIDNAEKEETKINQI